VKGPRTMLMGARTAEIAGAPALDRTGTSPFYVPEEMGSADEIHPRTPITPTPLPQTNSDLHSDSAHRPPEDKLHWKGSVCGRRSLREKKGVVGADQVRSDTLSSPPGRGSCPLPPARRGGRIVGGLSRESRGSPQVGVPSRQSSPGREPAGSLQGSEKLCRGRAV